MGEIDVLDAVAHVQTLYNIDPERIILAGFSMVISQAIQEIYDHIFFITRIACLCDSRAAPGRGTSPPITRRSGAASTLALVSSTQSGTTRAIPLPGRPTSPSKPSSQQVKS